MAANLYAAIHARRDRRFYRLFAGPTTAGVDQLVRIIISVKQSRLMWKEVIGQR